MINLMTVGQQISENRWRTLIVVLGFAALILALTLAIAGLYDPSLAGFVGAASVAYGLIAWLNSGKIVASVAGARPITRDEYKDLWNAVDNAAIAAGIAKTPPVYVIDDPSPNAFAAGRSPETAYVAATTGLLNLMNKRELEGVMAHEMAHVKNRDVSLMTLAAVLTGSIVLLCDILIRVFLFGGRRNSSNNSMGAVGVIAAVVVIVLAPVIAGLMQMALSRKREFLADAMAVDISGDADGLASALEKLAADSTPLQHASKATAHMYIESPLREHKGIRSGLGGMFDTHPPLQERIRRLRLMGGLTVEDQA